MKTDKKILSTRLVPLRISLTYIAISSLWIVFSDKLLAGDPDTIILLSTIKGWFYTLVVGILLYIVLVHELSHRLDVEKELSLSEERYRALFMNSPDAYMILIDGVFVDCNVSTEVMFRGNRRQIIGRTPGELSPEFQADGKKSIGADKEKIKQTLKSGFNFFEWQHRRFDGSVFFVEVSIASVSLDGKPALFATCRDISRRHEAETALKSNQAILEQAESIAHLGHYRLDIKSGLWVSSSVLDDVLGIDRYYERSIKGWMKMVAPDDRKMMSDYFTNEVLKKRHSFDKEYRIIRADNQAERWVYGRGQLEFDEQGEPVRMIGTIQDITERKQLEVSLKRKNHSLKMLNESNQALIMVKDEKELIDRICRTIVKVGEYSLAWIGLFDASSREDILLVNQSSYGRRLFKDGKLVWQDMKKYFGPSGQAAQSGQTIILNNNTHDHSWDEWRQEALQLGYLAAMAIPLKSEDKLIGVLLILSANNHDFNDQEDVDTLNEFANDLAFGINSIRTRDENKKFQAALELSEAKYRNLFETAKEGVIIVDYDSGETLEVNKFFINLFGLKAEDYLHKKIWESGPLSGLIFSRKIFTEYRQEKDIHYENYPLFTHDGRTVRAEIVSNVSAGEKFKVIQYSIRDNSEHYELEKSILQSERRYSALVESSNDAVVLIQDGLVKYANPAIEKLCDLSPKDVIGKPIVNFVAPKFKKIVADNYRRRMEGGEVTSRYEFAIVDKKGHNIPVETNSSVVIYEGRPAVIAIIRDISRAKQLDKIKSEFISIASHQLRTPLTGIKWFGQLLIDQKVGRLSSKQLDFIKQIYSSNERMIRLVNDLLDVSHIETGHKFYIDKKKGDIIVLIKTVIADELKNFPEKGMEIAIDDNCARQMSFKFDNDKIYQVLSNLLTNAIKYSGDSKKIIVGFDCPKKEKKMRIFIKDFGLGIPAHQQSRIFQKFFRADNIAIIATEGTGLGLYIAKSIVEAHGGEMWFESEENKGTTFFFTLPL